MAQPEIGNQKRFALLLGNSHYSDPKLAQLNAPQGDAGAFAAVLGDAAVGGFDEAVTLIDKTAGEIRIQIARFFANRGRDDLLLLYFSGHGVLDDRGRLYLAASDTEVDLLTATAIEAGFITDAMDRSRSTRQILILDCCHSGAFARGAKGAVGQSVGTGTAFEGTGSGRVILTASDATQYAWEGEHILGSPENSVFTRYLVEGLRTGEADLNQDGWVALDEWYDYVYDKVVEETPRQTPGKWSYKQQGDLLISRNPHPPATPKPVLPQELLDTIADPRSWVREGAVTELARLLTGNPAMAGAARAALEELVNDDSRRVANSAAASLAAAFPPPVPAAVEQEPPILVPEAAGVVIGPEAVVTTYNEPPAGAVAAAAGVEKAAAAPATGRAAAWRKALSVAQHPTLRPAVLLAGVLSLGWVVSLGLTLVFYDSRAIYLGWAAAGLMGDLILWRMYRADRFSWLPVLAVGWPLILLLVDSLYTPMYQYYLDQGDDVVKTIITIVYLALWVALFGALAAGRATRFRSIEALWKAALCTGGVLLVSLLITGSADWEMGLYKLTFYSPSDLLNHLDGSTLRYFALAFNGILAALLGTYLWLRWTLARK